MEEQVSSVLMPGGSHLDLPGHRVIRGIIDGCEILSSSGVEGEVVLPVETTVIESALS